jgi:PAS domain S-box-containing protein
MLDSTVDITHELLRLAFANLPLGVVIVDAQGLIVAANRGMWRLLGYTGEELIGQTVERLIPDRYARSHPAARVEYSIHPRPRPMGVGRELLARHRDGHEIPVEIGLSPVVIGDRTFVVSTLADVTERRQLESQLQQAQKLEAIGNLASGIAHDFNNILSGILGYAELARGGATGNPELQANLDQVIVATQQGRDLVGHILTFARKGSPHRRSVNWQPVLRDTVKLMRVSLPPNVDIRLDRDSVVPDVLADPVELQQIFMNLVMNAVHATASSGGTIDVRVATVHDPSSSAIHADSHGQSQVCLSVIDNGSGMTPTTLSRIFEPFFTTKAPGEGTGLGMFVIQRLVRSLRGTVAVKSSEGKGTQVDIYLPAINADNSQFRTAALSRLPSGTSSDSAT